MLLSDYCPIKRMIYRKNMNKVKYLKIQMMLFGEDLRKAVMTGLL